MKNQICQTAGHLETIIIFVWALFEVRRLGFGVKIGIHRESLLVEIYLRARGAEEEHRRVTCNLRSGMYLPDF